MATATARKRRLLAAAFIGTAAVLSACSGNGESTDSASETTASSAPAEGSQESAAALPEPDLADLPDVVAVVNGTEIGRELFTTTYESQFKQAAASAQASGQELDQDLLKTSVADNLVSAELLRQEADSRGIEATDEARAAAIADLLETSQLESEEALRAAFEEQGLDDAEFDQQLSDQVKLDALLADEAGDTTPSDEEIQDTYDAAVAEQEASGETSTPIPPLEDVRAQIVEQLSGDKLSAATQALIAQLREDADITVNL
ncbi:SurA N-terminal domain-containing protein [Arthrobacter agilis]|uniref:SurA N-terminal domain-containing protein n=1 Tax=Arthrobacter agilis TaxID=37921 RepID=UPI0023668448|nr:SurA N-terminal domain-containing protein [Arthrobacter agilis]WDF33641.1 SurA N-terminal domain-containing protein [Arthrobacter agilis]